jgi:hypothetical protein
MATQKKTKDVFVPFMMRGETASQVFDRVFSKYIEDVGAIKTKTKYTIREFAKEHSIDTRGEEALSPTFTISHKSLSSVAELMLKLKSVSVDPVLAKKNKRLVAAGINKFCNQIEQTIGAPNLPDLQIKLDLKIRQHDEIKERLSKFERREIFELKSLREIWPEIKCTQNRSTVEALKILRWLYNAGRCREQHAIIELLHKSIIDRERDKLFYVRKHPKSKMLHMCNDDTILERIKHLEWMFIDGSPFKKVEGVQGAISRFN